MGHRRPAATRAVADRTRAAGQRLGAIWPMAGSSCKAAAGSRSRPQGHSWTRRSPRPPPWTRTGGYASWSCATARSTCAISASRACGSIGARSECRAPARPRPGTARSRSSSQVPARRGPDWQLEGATAQADLDVRLADGRLSVSPRAPATLQLASLSWAEDRAGQRAGGARAAGRGSAAQRRAGGRSNAMAAARAREPAGIRDRGHGRQDAVAASPRRPPSWPSSWPATGRDCMRGRVVLSDGAVRAPAHQLRLSGIAADLHLSASGLDPAQPNPVSIASIVHEGAPPWFAPLRLTGVVRPKGDEGRLRSRARPPGRRPQDARARAA